MNGMNDIKAISDLCRELLSHQMCMQCCQESDVALQQQQQDIDTEQQQQVQGSVESESLASDQQKAL